MSVLRSGALLGALLCAAPSLAADSDCKTCDKPQNAPTLRAATPRSDAPSLGPTRAPVTIEVWSDFECSFCAKGAERLQELREKYGDSVRVVFRHNPLPRHRNAALAAEASVEAQAQGRFWEFHDALFKKQGTRDRAALEAVAFEVGMDLGRFKSALDSRRGRGDVEQDTTEAKNRGVSGTPTFFINGTPVVGAQPIEVLSKAVDAELARTKR